MRYTPGPWWKTRDKLPVNVPCHDANGCQVIAIVKGWLIYSKDSVPHQISPREARANASIITAVSEVVFLSSTLLYLSREGLRKIYKKREEDAMD